MSRLDAGGLPWAELRELRAGFLDGSAGDSAYWHTTELLDAYDRTFGERIGWKWDHVLDELELRGWSPPMGPVLDWGCGSGVAGRRFLGRYPGTGPLGCSDRSARAEEYARRRATEAGIEVAGADPPSVILISHVIGELDDAGVDRLVELIRRAQAVVWVEPGDHASSRRLSAVRDRLLGDKHVVAPCTHQRPCWLLLPENESHWCHHFASPPPEAFTDPGWGRFTSETGIDLRSLPVSFVVMDARDVPAAPPGAVHTIGRPRVYKAEARVFGCDAGGVADVRITKRRLPDEYRRARKGGLESIARWDHRDGEVVRWSPVE